MPSDRTLTQSRHTRFAFIGNYLKNYKCYIIIGSVVVVAANALALFSPYIIKKIFELLERGAGPEELLPQVLFLLGIAVGSGILSFVTRRTFLWMGRRIEYAIKQDLLTHVIHLSSSFFRKTHTGDIMSRMTSDIETVRTMLGQGILHAAETLVIFLIAIPMMIYLSPKLTCFSLAPVILFPILINRLGNAIHSRYLPIQKQYAKLTSIVQENLAGLRVVRAYCQEDSQIKQFEMQSRKYITLNMKLARLYGVFFPLTLFMASCLTLSAFYFGGLEVIRGTIPLGTLVAFFVYLGLLFWPIFALGGLISMYQRGTVSLDRINEFFSVQPEAPLGLGYKPSASVKGHIEFRNTHFSYQESAVLENINLTIEPGRHVGIIGRTGAGKTTLVSLLPRLFPIDDGQIFIDGVDINQWDPGELRGHISFVTQEAFLFSGTISDNIKIGRNESGTEAAIRAADKANLTEDVQSFEEGFETLVGERGVLLSGGQKQRTSIARAINHNPTILILDDITSAVDTETEANILSRISEFTKERTTITISQRIATVRNADIILFMDKGRITEQGTHDHLVELNGQYAKMHRLQQMSEELDKS